MNTENNTYNELPSTHSEELAVAGRVPTFRTMHESAFLLPDRPSAEEARTKQEAGNHTAPSGSESYSLLARWSSHLVKNHAEESSTTNMPL